MTAAEVRGWRRWVSRMWDSVHGRTWLIQTVGSALLTAMAFGVAALFELKGRWYLAPSILGLILLFFLIVRTAVSLQDHYKWMHDDGQDTEERLLDNLLHETRAMANHALAKGLPVEARSLQVVATLEERGPELADIGEIASAHRHLVEVVYPATPSTLRLLRDGVENSFFKPLGRVRLIRHMLYVAVFFLVASVVIVVVADPLGESSPLAVSAGDEAAEPLTTSTTTTTTTTTTLVLTEAGDEIVVADPEGPEDESVVEQDVPTVVGEAVLGSETTDRLWNSLFLIAVAGLGAAFYALYTAAAYVRNNSYDQHYEPTYWMRFVLGLVGGFSLAVLIGDEFIGDETLGITVLAFVGGFSADVVYRVLQRIVETIDTLVRGSGKERVADRERAARDRAANETAEQRIRLAAPLIALDAQLEQIDDAEVRRRLAEIIRRTLPFQEPAPGDGDGIGNGGGQ